MDVEKEEEKEEVSQTLQLNKQFSNFTSIYFSKNVKTTHNNLRKATTKLSIKSFFLN